MSGHNSSAVDHDGGTIEAAHCHQASGLEVSQFSDAQYTIFLSHPGYCQLRLIQETYQRDVGIIQLATNHTLNRIGNEISRG
jgi:hypothetical protein